LQTIAHFILGAALAYANGADPLAGDSAAVAAERAAGYLAKQYDDGHTAIDPISGQFNPNLLPEHIKEEIKAQTGAIASVVGAAGGSLNGTSGTNTNALFNAQVGGVLGQNAMENNYLTSTTLDDVRKGKKSKEDALRIYRINKENLERQCATSQSSSLCRAAANTAKDFVNNQLAKHFFPDEVKTTNQLLEKYSEAAQYKPAPLKINLRMEKSMFTGKGLPDGQATDYVKGTGKGILAYVWDERGGATGGAQYGMPIGTFAYNQYALENPYQTTKTRQEYLGSVYGPAVLTLTGAKFRIRPTRPITTKPTQGKIIPIGESYIPSSPRAVQGTTVTLMQEQRLANGQVIPKGSKVTWSDNAVKVVRPDGSKRVFSSRDWEQKALPAPTAMLFEPIIQTRISQQVMLTTKQKLPPAIADTFKNGMYQTVTTKEPITVYRKFGGTDKQAKLLGGYATTISNAGRSETAVYPRWSSMQFEAVIEIPKNQSINIGKVAPQPLNKKIPKYRGGEDQILLPVNYPISWVKFVRDGKTGKVYTPSEFIKQFPEQINRK